MNNKLCSGLGRYYTDKNGKQFLCISYAAILTMVANPPTTRKQYAQWIIASTLLSRSKSAQMEYGEFYLLVVDLDHNPPPINKVAEIVALACRGSDFLIYTSRSATKNCQKSHVLIPTVKLTWYRWWLAQCVLNDIFEKAGATPDRKMEDANQIFFLPNRGQHYDYIHQQGPEFDPVKSLHPEMLKKHQVIKADKEARVKKATSRPARPINQGRSLIDEFNATYPVEDLLIQSGYAQKGSTFRHPNSNTGNYSASVKNGKVFTLSSADPLYSTYAHDAFNVFVILFHGGDRKAALLSAGNDWLNVGNISWNKHQQQVYREGK